MELEDEQEIDDLTSPDIQPASTLINDQIKEKLPWKVYNLHFKVHDIVSDCESYITYRVSCNHCYTNKFRTADSRSVSNLRKHLKVTICTFSKYTLIVVLRMQKSISV